MNTKQLRQKVLDLAIRGKLVPQDPNDEPTSVLLEKIRAEKERLIKEKKIKPDKKNGSDKSHYRQSIKNYELPITNAPFEVPESWEWCRLGEIATHNTGKTLDKSRNTGTLREYITTSNLYWGRFDFSELREMPINNNELDRCTAIKGDLLICEGGDAGRSAIWDFDKSVCFQNHIHRVRPFEYISTKYLYFFMHLIYLNGEINAYLKGVGIQSLSGDALASILIPLPPLAEQRRIVATIETAFVEIDKIEQNKIELQQFIKQTKQKVLDLAIRGKLVPQNPDDEPASALLERIKSIKNDKLQIVRNSSDKFPYPFEVPKGWRWCQFNELFKTISSKPFQILQSDIQPTGNFPVISQSQNFIEGYSNKSNKVLKVNKALIVFGDHTRSIKFIDFDFIVGADGVKILSVYIGIEKYLYYFLIYMSFYIENRGYARHFQLLQKELIPLPPLAEQQRIVNQIEKIFTQLDEIEKTIQA